MSTWHVRVRVTQTVGEIDRLTEGFSRWLNRRVAADAKNRYHTQLNALGELVKGLLAALRHEVPTGVPSDVSEAYRYCRLQEKRLLWVEKSLWGFYQQKFDQRDQEDQAQVLEAADDVVWSCYKEACNHTGVKEIPPLPLAYFEPYFSPQTLPRSEPPAGWAGERGGDPLLKEYFSQLPIPVVSLPPACLGAPWWLVYLGHETGHHVQVDLDLVACFGKDLRDAAMAQPAPAEQLSEAQRWWDWNQEIFADLFSVYMVGAGAVWAIAELVRTHLPDLLLRQNSYPPGVARLALLAAHASNLGMPGAAALGEITPASASNWILDDPYQEEFRQEALLDVNASEFIRKAALVSSLNGRGPFKALTGWNGLDFTPNGLAGLWLKAFRKGELRVAQRSLRAARLITSAALERWREIAAVDPAPGQLEPDLKQQAKDLKTLYLKAIDENRDETTRAETPQKVIDVASLTTGLSQRLLHLEFPEAV